MRRSSVLTRPLSGLLTFLMVSVLLIVGSAQSVRAQSESTVLINEVSINPAGTDQPYEYIELTGTASTSLNNLYLVVFEGDSTSDGISDLALNLSSATMGTNGFLVFTSVTGGHSIPAGTTVLTDTRLNTGGTSPLENGTTSIVLISSTTAIAQATDYDTNNDGVLELPSGAVIQDAVGWTDGGASDHAYGGVILTGSGTLGAATRFVGNTTPLSSSAWYGGALTGLNSDVTYSTTVTTGNVPLGGVLTPGTTNYAAPTTPVANLALTGSVNNSTPDEAESITYTFTVSNSGPDATTGVAVEVTLPTGVTYTSNDAGATEASGVISWTVGALANGGSASINIVAHADDASLGPQFTVLGEVTASDEDDSNSTPNNLGASPAEDDEDSVVINVVSAVACSTGFTPIYTLQDGGVNYGQPGSFTTQGIVVGDYQSGTNATGSRGFYIQDETGDANTNTSDGIFVFDSTNAVDVNLGDRVRVTGTLSEFNLQTQITMTAIEPCGSTGSITPTPVSLPFASATSPEILEGMLVSFSQTLTVSEVYELGRFGQVVLSSGGRLYIPTALTTPGANANVQQAANDLNQIYLDDGRVGQNPDPTPYMADYGNGLTRRVGDTVTNLQGVMSYTTYNVSGVNYPAYRIQPVNNPTFVNSNPRTAAPSVDGDLVIASFNVLNYFNGPTFPTSRGATTALEFSRQRDKTIAAIHQMNADVIGLMEMENDATGGSAVEDLVAGLNAVAGAGTYDFIDTGVIGTDVIRVAIIYKPASVTPLGSPMVDMDSVHNRPPVVQTFEDNTTGGIFNVVVNHFKSKGCDVDATGLDADLGDGQSCYNGSRVEQSAALLDFIDDVVIPTSGDSDVLIIGDLNAYTFEDPITALEAAGYTNLIRSLLGLSAYSYVFSGETGYLDHALGSASIVSQVSDIAEWHINPDEPLVLDYNMEFKSDTQDALNLGTPYRASDHDPVMVGLSLTSDIDPITVSMDAATGSGTEASAGQVSVDVVLDLSADNGVTTDEVTASVMLSGTAVEASDYTLGSSSVTFPVGSVDGATQTLLLTIVDDSLFEGNETVEITLNGATNASVGTAATFTYTINEDETALVSFGSASSSVDEDDGTATIPVVLNLTWTSASAGSLQDAGSFRVTDEGTGSATAGTDYTFTQTDVTFTAGSVDDATQNVTVTITNDSEAESAETVELDLDGLSGIVDVISPTDHTLTINNVTPPQTATVQFTSAGDASVNENGTTYNVGVTLTTSDGQPLVNALSVDVSDLVTGSATPTTDYSFSTSTLTFGVSATSGSTQVAVIGVVADSEDESDETVNMSLGNLTGTNASLGAQTSYTFTITDDDTTVGQTATVAFSAAASSSPDESGTAYDITVVLTTSDGQPLVNAVTVDVSDLATGSATTGVDYNFSTTTVTFAATAASGSTQVANVAVVSDSDDESDETVIFGLGNVTGTGASIGTPNETTFTITDDDTAATPSVTLSRTTLSARPNGVRTYTVVLNTQPSGDVVIAVSQPTRCLVRPRNLTFTTANWNVPQTVTVTVRKDPFPGTRCVMRHTATGGGYDGVVISNVVLTIIRPQ